MALIGKLRQQKWLLVGTMAAALLLFIAMLMFDNPNQSLFGASNTALGSINGSKVEAREFNNIYDMLYQNQATSSGGYSERTSLWNFFVDEAIVNKEAEAVGLGVSKTELLDLQFSEDPKRLSPIITSRYVDQASNQVNMDQLRQLKDIITTNKIDQLVEGGQLTSDFKARWAYQEKEIIKDRLQTKLTKMVEKGLYTPGWMAEMISTEQNEKIDFLYVQVPFDEIENSAVTLADGDYKAWYEENKNQFKQDEETRVLEYVSFPVTPSAQDSAAYRKKIADLVEGFSTAESDSIFVEVNLGSIDAAYVTKAQLSPVIADTLLKVPVGSVVGPYIDAGAYQAVKLIDRKVVPDSVRARHILLTASDQASAIQARKTVDSLVVLLKAGTASFDSLAPRFSTDQSNANKGGDLGFFAAGRMVKAFNDMVFYEAQPGEIKTVITEFGIHIIEVTDRKFTTNSEGVKVAYISEAIIPSTTTQSDVSNQAEQLRETSPTLEDLRKNAAAIGMEVTSSPAFKANDFSVGTLGVGPSSRDMVRWAFGTDPNTPAAKLGKVSPRVYGFQEQNDVFTNKFVVAGLKSIRPKGIAKLDDIKADVEAEVIKYKKGEMLKERMKGKTLESIASEFSVQVDTALAVTYATAFIQKAGGAEPKVVANAFLVDLNQVSEPLVGNSGVFMVKPLAKPQAAPAGDMVQVQRNTQMSSRGQVRGKLLPALKKKADIEDSRSKFF